MIETPTERIVPQDFTWLKARLVELTGNVLEDSRRFFAEDRLRPLLWRHQCPGFQALFQRLRDEPAGPLEGEVIDTLTSGETWFFRDNHPFETLRAEILPLLIAARHASKTLTFWSAGCGTGQEAYSLSLLLLHHFPQLQGWNIRILGTDVSAGAIERARLGVYDRAEVNRGLPIALLAKYFEQNGHHWQLGAAARERVRFLALRLDQPWEGFPRFDVILLRNVLPYFSPQRRAELFDQARAQLAMDGALFLGAAESYPLPEGLEQIDGEKGRYYRRLDQPGGTLAA